VSPARTQATDKAALAVVIGRAGSKGLPNKNARLVAGRPMVCYSIDDARAASCVDELIVSTDCEGVAAAAREMGASVVDRPPALATDEAPIDDAVRHAIRVNGGHHDVVVILYANVPVRPPGLIDRAVRELCATGADSVQSYTDVGKHHPAWMVRLDEQGRVMPVMDSRAYRRQDLPSLLIPDGGVIAVRRAALLTVVEGEPHAFLGRDRRGIISAPGSVVDVDDERDLLVAETRLERRELEIKR
jgi:CMP-N-acetylneuraminic acid synthetase